MKIIKYFPLMKLILILKLGTMFFFEQLFCHKDIIINIVMLEIS